MNVRDYMHEISSQNANTRSSTEEGSGEGKRKMSKEEALIEQQNKNKVRSPIPSYLPSPHPPHLTNVTYLVIVVSVWLDEGRV